MTYVEQLTRRLVAFPSINGTDGEVAKASFLEQLLREIPYFHQYPQHIWRQKLADGRENVFALLESEQLSKKTIVWHAHYDTVDVDDYQSLKAEAFNPDALEQFFREYRYDLDVQADAASGDWLFGRGALDMQSGIAVHIANLKQLSERRHEWQGTIVCMFNPDEENAHSGVRGAVHELARLKVERQLDYVAAINTDFITPMYENDPHRYIYTGVAGKLLPCFYIAGREAHVGDTLSSVDPNYISAEIMRRVHHNLDLTEQLDGELVLPPTCLYQRDTKTSYTVQTATTTHLYFNYFIYKKTAAEVMHELTLLAQDAALAVEQAHEQQYAEFLRRTKLPARPLNWQIDVVTLSEYKQKLTEQGVDVAALWRDVHHRYSEEEPRQLAFRLVDELQKHDEEKRPRIIIFFAPPYLPHNYLREDSAIVGALERALQTAPDETFALRKFFPYLADGSFLSMHETDEEMKQLTDNFPSWDQLYPLPLETIRELNIPSLMMGVYGKDGHKWTERVYKPYSFNVLPPLIIAATKQLLQVDKLF